MEEAGERGGIPGAARCLEEAQVWCLAEGALPHPPETLSNCTQYSGIHCFTITLHNGCQAFDRHAQSKPFLWALSIATIVLPQRYEAIVE